MNSFKLMAFLAFGATANSYGPANSPIRINFESRTLSSPTSYTLTSYPSSTMYSHYTSPSSSYYSQPSSFLSYPPTSSSTSYYSSPSSSPSSYSSYGYAPEDKNAAITSFIRNIQPSSSDTTSFTTSNGISSSHNVQVVRGRPTSYKDEYGQSVQSDTTITMNGHSSHQSPEGMQISLTWNADENGFVPKGSHIVQLPEDHAEAHRQAHLRTASSFPSSGYGSSSPSSNPISYKSPQMIAPITYPSYSAPPQPSAYRLV